MVVGLRSLDRASVERFLRDWAQAFDDADHRRMADYYAEDARLIATESETVGGRVAIERFWHTASQGARAAGIRRTVALEEIGDSGDLAFMRGTVDLAVPGADGPARYRYLTLWRRESDDVWRLYIDISNVAPRRAGA
jgi:uncharacterized protein (TIGR02246 family)